MQARIGMRTQTVGGTKMQIWCSFVLEPKLHQAAQAHAIDIFRNLCLKRLGAGWNEKDPRAVWLL